MEIFLNFIKTYRWIIIPAFPALLFFILLISLPFLQQPAPTEQLEINPRPTAVPTTSPEDSIEYAFEEPPETIPGFQKKVTLSDGTELYTFTSSNPNRPEIILAHGDHDVEFQRKVIDPRFPVQIASYIEAYGEPEDILQGSRFYGADKQIYFYGKNGFAFIVDPQTGQGLEEHFFQPISLEEYLKKYGQ